MKCFSSYHDTFVRKRKNRTMREDELKEENARLTQAVADYKRSVKRSNKAVVELFRLEEFNRFLSVAPINCIDKILF